MRIGSGGGSPFGVSHQAGMSSLWHDIDYSPEKLLDAPLVHKGLDGMALPSEEHQVPEGVKDPFAAMDDIYKIAADDMDRGVKGMAFLNGANSSNVSAVMSAHDSVAEANEPRHAIDQANDLTRTVSRSRKMDPTAATEQRHVAQNKAVEEQLAKRDKVGTITPQSSNTGSSSSEKSIEAQQKALKIAEGLGVALVTSTVMGGIDVGTGAAANVAAEAGAVVKALATAKMTVGVSQGISGNDEIRRAKRHSKAKQILDGDYS